MQLAWKIAKRYFIAKRSHHLINIISKVSVIGVGVGTMGLIIVLSVFNGFGNLVLSMYNSFDPDLKITPVHGKTFDPDKASLSRIKTIKGVESVSVSLEENALLRYRDRQFIATIKGVDEDYFTTTGLQNKIIDGTSVLQNGAVDYMFVGGQIAYSLGLKTNDPLNRISVFVPLKGVDAATALTDPTTAFAQRSIIASGIFSVQQDFDTKYVIVPLRFMREMMSDTISVSALEIKLAANANSEEVMKQVEQLTGKDFEVKDRYRQHDFLYKILKSEKAGVYLILGFILLIATFNIFGTLTMLIIDKKKDIVTLMNLGATLPLVQRIFLIEGLLISLGGALGGMIVGTLICFLQQTFGIIKLDNSESFIVQAYPVDMQLNDFLLVFLIVFVIGFAAAWLTSRMIVKRQLD